MPDTNDDTGFTHTVEVVEIKEVNVEEIGFEAPDLGDELIYEPVDGSVKWFRDELHQIWVKLVVEVEEEEGFNLKVLVIPANKVNYVQYPKLKQ